MASSSLRDGAGTFDVTVVEAAEPRRIVVFAVGGGGDPGRHRPLLEALAEHGSTVVAPHFELLQGMEVTDDELLLRASRLKLALDSICGQGQRGPLIAGVGHSIGATTLLALATGHLWIRRVRKLTVDPDPRLARLVLLAPATVFFQATGALDSVTVPVLAWAGAEDAITPPAQVAYLEHALQGRVPFEMRVTHGAGHFSFMYDPPPGTIEPLSDRNAFLDELAREVCRFLSG